MIKQLLFTFGFAVLLFGQTRDDTAYEAGEIFYFQKGCYSCHGPTGQGMHTFPKVANLRPGFLEKKLHAYRNDEIKTPQASIMTAYAKALSPEEMKAIVYYLDHFVPQELDKRYDDSYRRSGDGGS